MLKSFLLSGLCAGDDGTSHPIPGVTGQGYSGGGHDHSGGGHGHSGGGAQWERGANLQEYYAKKEEQEAEAVPD